LPRFSARIASGDPLISGRQGTLLGDENGDLVGIITRGDMVRCFDRSRDETLTIGEAGSTKLIVAYPDETLHDAMARVTPACYLAARQSLALPTFCAAI